MGWGGVGKLPPLTHNCHLLFIPLALSHTKRYLICTYVVTAVHVTKFYLHCDANSLKDRASHADIMSRFRAVLPGNSGDLWTGNSVQNEVLGSESSGSTDPFLWVWGWNQTRGRTGSCKDHSAQDQGLPCPYHCDISAESNKELPGAFTNRESAKENSYFTLFPTVSPLRNHCSSSILTPNPTPVTGKPGVEVPPARYIL